MNIKIILVDAYPHGMACTARVHNYAKGITEQGVEVQILVPKPTERDATTAVNREASGNYQGIDFAYTCRTTIRPDSFIKRRFLVLKGIFIATKELAKSRRNLDAVLLVSNSLGYILSFKLLTTVLGAKYLQEKSELPFINKDMNLVFKIYSYFYTTYIYRCFDGMLVISRYLSDYFRPKIRKKAGLLLVPITVNPDEFVVPKDGNVTGNVVYCGNLSQRKDGILTLIQAFKIVSEKVPHVKLQIVGDTHKKRDKEKVRELIARLNLQNRVVLTGYVSRTKLLHLLCNASVLLLAKPSSLQADSCFPSKLGEYLATGNPVVVTETGEIPYYLRDGKNAFLAKPNSVDSFAQKLDCALSKPELAREIGLNGRDTALANFDYKVQAKRIINFINELNQRLS